MSRSLVKAPNKILSLKLERALLNLNLNGERARAPDLPIEIVALLMAFAIGFVRSVQDNGRSSCVGSQERKATGLAFGCFFKTLLRWMINFLMQATKATFFGFPLEMSRR